MKSLIITYLKSRIKLVKKHGTLDVEGRLEELELLLSKLKDLKL